MAKKHTAREILVQARETIEATYWVKGHEFVLAEKTSRAKKVFKVLADADSLDENEKLVFPRGVNPWEQEGSVGKAKVTGVCLIGAFALASSVLNEQPLATFGLVAERDPASAHAAMALAAYLALNVPTQVNDRDSVITSWNDNEDRKRKEVIEVLDAVIKHPLSGPAGKRPWGWLVPGRPSTFSALRWTTEKQAREALERVDGELSFAHQSEWSLLTTNVSGSSWDSKEFLRRAVVSRR